MHLLTTARIHASPSPSPFSPLVCDPPFFEGGWWNATFLPGCNGNCGANASLRAFGSRENGMAGCKGMPLPCREAVVDPTAGVPVLFGVEGIEDGEDIRGRFIRFSVLVLVQGGLYSFISTYPAALPPELVAKLTVFLPVQEPLQ